MSFRLLKVENSPLLSKTANEYLKKNYLKIVPTETFISELPSLLKSQIFKPYFILSEFGEFADITWNQNVRPNDVFICSIPKCGSSWTTTIAWLLTHNLDYEHIQNVEREKLMGDLDELFNVTAAKERANELLGKKGTEIITEDAALKLAWNEIFNRLEAPRILKSHSPPYLLPKQIWEKHARIIYVARNPKDMAVSLYYMIRNYFHVNVTMDDIVNSIINDISFCSPHSDHVKNFLKLKRLPNVLIVHYEDLVNDSFATVKKISEFLKCNYSDEQLQELTKFISFENMKQIKTINREDSVVKMEILKGKPRPDADFTFLRKGKTGSYRNDLSEDQIKKLDDWAQREMKNETDFKFKI